MSEVIEGLKKLADRSESGTDIAGPEVGAAVREAVTEIEKLLEQREKLAYIARRLAALKDESKPGMPGYSALAITVERMRLLEGVDEIAGNAVGD